MPQAFLSPLRWFERMSANDVRGDYVTYTALINACAKRSDAFGAMKWLQRIVDLWQQSHVPLLQHGILTWVAEIGRGPVRHSETTCCKLAIQAISVLMCGCRLFLDASLYLWLQSITCHPPPRSCHPEGLIENLNWGPSRDIKGILATCPRPETVRENTGDAFKCLERLLCDLCLFFRPHLSF